MILSRVDDLTIYVKDHEGKLERKEDVEASGGSKD